MLINDPSFPYISGNSFSIRCKYLWENGKLTKNSFIENDWVFVRTDDIHAFFSSKQIPDSFTILTHNGDSPVNQSHLQFIEDVRVKKWFAQNLEISHPKIKSIPIGIANSNYSHGNAKTLTTINKENISKSQLLYVNFTVGTNQTIRQKCLDETGLKICNDTHGGWHGFAGGYKLPNTFEGYLRDMKKSYFTISPRGNGLDCHRTWEALYMQCIPIVIKSSITEHHSGFPFLVLNDWSEFKNLHLSKDLYQNLWKNFDISELYAENYIRKYIRCQ